MQAKGASPEGVFLAAEEVMIRAHGGAASLAEHQEQLLPSLKQALKDES